MSTVASIIIPTHNRSASLKKMLDRMNLQSYPLQSFEVIVVADGCKDDTMIMLTNYKPDFSLTICELPGLGAATARNRGASVASGQYLVFVDDDMELSNEFIKKHVAAHTNENTVVIGYSPFKLELNASIQRMVLREWWEEKFEAMRDQQYRFKYTDLTSGNFSVSSELFKKVDGFDTSLLCREDYELGYRLIKAGAQFQFEYEAKAFHCDEVTNVNRSLQRKRMEGAADIQIKKKHPDFSNKEAAYYLSQRSFLKSLLTKVIQYVPSLSDAAAGIGTKWMQYFEKLKMHPMWLRLNYRLLQYWYLRGLMENAQTAKELYQFIADKKIELNENQKLTIDLQKGLKEAEKEIDRHNPKEVTIYFGEKFIGIISYDPGTEPIKGMHLRRILRNHFFNELASVLAPKVSVQNAASFATAIDS